MPKRYRKSLFAIVMAVTTANETNEFVIDKGLTAADCFVAIRDAGKRSEVIRNVRISRSFFCEKVN